MTLLSELHWYAIHAKPAREPLAAAKVNALGVETYFPRLRRESAARIRIKPLFPGYLFARFVPNAALESVRHAQGVLQVVSTGRFPLPIDDEVIASLREDADEDGCVHFVSPGFRVGDRVAIEQGPLQGLTGRVVQEPDDRRRITILLETILCARVYVQRDCLGAAAAVDC